MQTIKKFTVRSIAAINILAIFLLLIVGYSDRFHPVSFPSFSFLGLVFPLILGINIAFLVFWAIFKVRMCLLPILGLFLAYVPIKTYFPLNWEKEVPQDALKVMSYNVHLFLGWDEKAENIDSLLQYIEYQNADILCLQESKNPYPKLQAKIDSAMTRLYPYIASVDKPGTEDRLTLYSKYPIVHTEKILYPHSEYLSAAHRVKIGKDTVTIINTHFLSTGLSSNERESVNKLFDNQMKADSIKYTSQRLMSQLSNASKFRSVEVDAVARYIDAHSHESIILCGDFNDSPISYTHHKLTKKLNDTFVESGRGVGVSFNRSRLYVRIDYILASDDWQSYNCHVDNKIGISDHYPVLCWLKKRDK